MIIIIIIIIIIVKEIEKQEEFVSQDVTTLKSIMSQAASIGDALAESITRAGVDAKFKSQCNGVVKRIDTLKSKTAKAFAEFSFRQRKTAQCACEDWQGA